MKKLFKYFVWITVSLAVMVALLLHFAPVSFDASACAGGYKTWVVDKYSEKLVSVFLAEQGLKKNTNFDLISKREEIAHTVEWTGRNIYATLKIDIEGKIYTVDYIGERYWIEKYNWKVINVTS